MINKLIGLPELASEHGLLIDNMLELLHWFIAILLFGWATFYVYCLIRFRKGRNPKADYVGVRGHASTHVEVGVVLVEIVLLLGFAFPLWGKRVSDYPATDPDVVKVRVVGERFKWTYHYPGLDGKFGITRGQLIPGSRFGLGIDPADPYGEDDFLASALILPKDRNCIIEISTKDVIHNLAIVPMRIQHDAISGTPAHMWFKPIKTGKWEMICAQLCGSGHSAMKGLLEVKEAEDYDKWYAGKAESAAPEKESLASAGE
ncbi:MAG: cytochrome c oxidase subunit 2 [Pseudoalteromonas tetraodonis]